MRAVLIILAFSTFVSHAVNTHGASDPAQSADTYGRGRTPEDGIPAVIFSDEGLLRVLASDPSPQNIKAAEDYINTNWLNAEAFGVNSRVKLSKYKISYPPGTYGINVSNLEGNSQVSTPIGTIITDGVSSFKRTVRDVARPR